MNIKEILQEAINENNSALGAFEDARLSASNARSAIKRLEITLEAAIEAEDEAIRRVMRSNKKVLEALRTTENA